MEERKLRDWIANYQLLTEHQESPYCFHLFSGLFVLSATLGRRAFLNRGTYRLFPNIYVFLVAASAQCRKGGAVGIAERMFQEANPKIQLIAQKLTQQSFFETLHNNYKEVGRSEAVMIAEELGVFLGGDKQQGLPMVQLLTKLYNCPDILDYQTRSRGREICNNSWGALLAGTTPEWLKTALPETSLEGGFVGRVLFVHAEKPKGRFAEPYFPDGMWENLVHDLRIIGQLEGEFKLTDDGRAFFIHWYENDFEPPTDETVRLDGYWGRKHDTLLKLAMLLSISQRNDLTINQLDLETGLKMLETIEPYISTAFEKIQTTMAGASIDHVYRLVKRGTEKDGGIMRTKLLRALSYKMHAEDITKAIQHLTAADLVEVEQKVTDGRPGLLYISRAVKKGR